MNKNLFALFCFVLIVISGSQGFAEDPVAGGLFPGWQYPDIKEPVYGIRVSPGFAQNSEMIGIDTGVIGNITDKRFIGMGFAGGFNQTSGKTVIVLLQLAGVANINTGDTHVAGIQAALGGNWGKKTKIYGLQFGFYNEAEHVYGFQVGVINRTTHLTGIQIGLANYVEKGWITFFPIINISI